MQSSLLSILNQMIAAVSLPVWIVACLVVDFAATYFFCQRLHLLTSRPRRLAKNKEARPNEIHLHSQTILRKNNVSHHLPCLQLSIVQ